MASPASERHRFALPAGFVLGKYVIEEQLGFGSFGITYRARDQALDRLVALKELLPTMIAARVGTAQVQAHSPDDEAQWEWARNRFLDEARALAACDHPNVLQVFETFALNGTVYMATRYEEGQTLSAWLRGLGRPATEEEVCGLLEPLLSALAEVHSRGFLHRDIKPDNIYLRRGFRPILIDFGSARQDVTNRSVPMTAIVTEGYAPLEQYTETGKQGPWTDLYALGAVFYTVITGKRPPTATERATTPDEDPCQPLAPRLPDLYSPALLRSVDQAMQLRPRGRLQNTEEWLELIRESRRHATDVALERSNPVAPLLAPSRLTATSGRDKGGSRWLNPEGLPLTETSGRGVGDPGSPAVRRKWIKLVSVATLLTTLCVVLTLSGLLTISGFLKTGGFEEVPLAEILRMAEEFEIERGDPARGVRFVHHFAGSDYIEAMTRGDGSRHPRRLRSIVSVSAEPNLRNKFERIGFRLDIDGPYLGFGRAKRLSFPAFLDMLERGSQAFAGGKAEVTLVHSSFLQDYVVTSGMRDGEPVNFYTLIDLRIYPDLSEHLLARGITLKYR